ncbi:DUF1056 family protein [Weissella viridescens]|jgi:hypothetical protein|uniref:DUF1056 family protein n=1 Tax=Weissella viridescens TaxID=1629 RepID=UPI001C7DFD53|nr:DUF1056 family protein [Weissella viridescens]MBX4172565.1 DUF1056 family protein [Weissella viridescens]MCB6839653.1 DUF1056 family protein [Weissella viridescens]MCB6846384.1 DUF1056 family protein [Weissella viridescens]DAJ62475.1 MAG TPA: Protein of unknown function (DUF1056) [Caudoviricetes sp.]
MLFKKLFANIWALLDVFLFLAAAITFNCGGFYLGQIWGYGTLTITFIIAGLLVEQLSMNKGGDA